MVQAVADQSENENAKTKNVAGSDLVPEIPQANQDGGLAPSAPANETVEEEDDDQPEIDSFTTLEVAGIKYVIGLGLDSQVYNWDVNTGKWRLFQIKRPDASSELDSVL